MMMNVLKQYFLSTEDTLVLKGIFHFHIQTYSILKK